MPMRVVMAVVMIGAAILAAAPVQAEQAAVPAPTSPPAPEYGLPINTEQAKAAAPSVDTAPGAEAVRAKNAAKARKSFEAFALQAFIGSMLPKENTKLFGTGSAGKLWQSVMAEKLAEQIASSGRLKLLPDEPVNAATAPPPANGGKTEPNGGGR